MKKKIQVDAEEFGSDRFFLCKLKWYRSNVVCAEFVRYQLHIGGAALHTWML